MNHFDYNNKNLYAESVDLTNIVDNIKTPFYCYSAAAMLNSYNLLSRELAEINNIICFSVKANSNLAILKLLGNQGAGCDVVSGGELQRALTAKIEPSKIVFSGVGKTEEEITFALNSNIGQINVESPSELYLVNKISTGLCIKAPIAIRINPDIDAKTNTKISTGRKDDKFGIAWADALELCVHSNQLTGITFKGIAVHIGSQITNLVPFEKAFLKVKSFVTELQRNGIYSETLDVGGGLGISYNSTGKPPPSSTDYASLLKKILAPLAVKIIIEPGRSITGNAGVLVTKVIYVKKSANKTFIIIDAAMNDLIRPAMYDAFHEIIPLKMPNPAEKLSPVDIVGPICETGDQFANQRMLGPINEGEFLAIKDVGAYGAVMSSTYNTRLLVPEVLVHNDKFDVIRSRPKLQDMLKFERIPLWLES